MESDVVKAERKDREAVELHARSRAAGSLTSSIVLRLRALWREETAKLLRKRGC